MEQSKVMLEQSEALAAAGPGSASSAAQEAEAFRSVREERQLPEQGLPPVVLKAPPPQLPASSGAVPAAAEVPVLSAVEQSADEQSEAPAAAGPGDASSAAQEAEVQGLGREEEEQPDWFGENSSMHTAFEVMPQVVQTLKSEHPDDASFPSARSAETVEVREALGALPPYLKRIRGQGMPRDQEFDEMKAMKARGVEHVRWRNVTIADDMSLRAVVSRMQGAAYARMLSTHVWDTWMMFVDRLAPGSASTTLPATTPQQFIVDAKRGPSG